MFKHLKENMAVMSKEMRNLITERKLFLKKNKLKSRMKYYNI